MQGQQRVAQLLVADGSGVGPQARRSRGGEIPTHRFGIQSELGGDSFLREPLAPQSEYFFEFDHRDVAKH